MAYYGKIIPVHLQLISAALVWTLMTQAGLHPIFAESIGVAAIHHVPELGLHVPVIPRFNSFVQSLFRAILAASYIVIVSPVAAAHVLSACCGCGRVSIFSWLACGCGSFCWLQPNKMIRTHMHDKIAPFFPIVITLDSFVCFYQYLVFK
jgi:hypothetical protein